MVPPTRSEEVSWSDPTNNDVVPREISWTISEETNYGGERLTLNGMEEENTKARQRLLGGPVEDDAPDVEPEEKLVPLAELDARLAQGGDREPKAN